MSKQKNRTDNTENPTPEPASLRRRLWIHGTIACLLLGALVTGFYYVQKYVNAEVAMPTEPPTIVIKNRPHWMSDYLLQRIAASARPTGLRSAFDHDMLVDVTKSLEANPWISKVYEVRRAFREKPGDTLEIDCEYRVPAALVKSGTHYILVDREGFKLPELYELADWAQIVKVEDGRIDIRIIEGVRRPPPETGKQWAGDDLAAGLEMVALLYDKPYAQEILKINVSRFTSSREPHVMLVTRYGTEIRWGRTPSELDKDPFLEISTAKKLDRLKRIYAQFGRVDAGQPDGIDIRFDNKVTTGAESGAATAGE